MAEGRVFSLYDTERAVFRGQYGSLSQEVAITSHSGVAALGAVSVWYDGRGDGGLRVRVDWFFFHT